MNDSQKLELIIRQLRNQYEFYNSLSEHPVFETHRRQVYKDISIVIAQMIENIDPSFVRKNYWYEIDYTKEDSNGI